MAIDNPDHHEGFGKALATLRQGQPVAVPTETVYGLAADATDPVAVARVFALKGRPAHNPLIVHVADLAMAERLAVLAPAARMLAAAFWPGPLTIVAPVRAEAGLAPAVTAGLHTVAMRCPDAPVMRALIGALGRPLAAPSANRSGHISPTTAAHVARSFGADAPLILDGGRCRTGLESTIVTVRDGGLAILREGPVAAADLAAATSLPVAARGAGEAISAPGQLASHYAPRAPVRLDWTDGRAPGVFVIGFGGAQPCDYDLSPAGDGQEAQANLYAALHAADASGAALIGVMPLPAAVVGPALLDRLARAAAPR